MDGRIMRCGIISSRQSAATSEIVKRYIKYLTFTFYNRWKNSIYNDLATEY